MRIFRPAQGMTPGGVRTAPGDSIQPRAMTPTRILTAFAAAALLTFGAVACGSDDSKTTSGAQTSSTETSTPSTTTTTDDDNGATETTPPKKDDGTVIVVKGGEPVGGSKSIKVKSGDKVKITVESDADAEIHLHGYEIKKSAAPGEPAEFEFDADIPGIFTMEVEDSGTQIAEIEVS